LFVYRYTIYFSYSTSFVSIALQEYNKKLKAIINPPIVFYWVPSRAKESLQPVQHNTGRERPWKWRYWDITEPY